MIRDVILRERPAGPGGRLRWGDGGRFQANRSSRTLVLSGCPGRFAHRQGRDGTVGTTPKPDRCIIPSVPPLSSAGISRRLRTVLGSRDRLLPLRRDLAESLRRHLADLGDDAGEFVFDVPSNFTRVFDADLAAAGIAKTDRQGRTLDVHCLRHTFATLLARSGVSPSVAQKLMRHSDIRLTMNIYTHLDLSDTAGAVAALPAV